MIHSSVQVGLAERIEHPNLMLKVGGSNHALSENNTSLPQSQVALVCGARRSATY